MKACDIDNGKYLTIGSLNQDHCSFYQNNEANVLLSSKNSNPDHYPQFIKIYQNLLKESIPVDPKEDYTYGSYLENRFWRLNLAFIRWFCHNREVSKK